jgi:spore maturation protein CgeB
LEHRPDWLLGLNMNPVQPSTLHAVRQAGTRVAFWYVDCFGESLAEPVVARAQASDVFFTTAGGLVPLYRQKLQTPVHWLVEGAYLPAFPTRLPPYPAAAYRSEVAFVGNIYHPSPDETVFRRRERLLKAIQRRHALRIWGPQGYPNARDLWGPETCPVTEWPAYHGELVKICQASDVVLGINLFNTIERYFSNRTFLTLASGGFHLTHYVPGLETMFDNHGHLVWYHSDEECLDLLGHYLKQPNARQAIARRGQAWVRQKYGMGRQFGTLLRRLGATCLDSAARMTS